MNWRRIALHVPQIRHLWETRNALLRERDELTARLAQGENGQFFHYAACFDPQEVMRRHAVAELQPTPGYLTNFLGVRIDPKFLPTILRGRGGQVEGIPIPANWHADIAEWGAALRAVDLAHGTFTMIELGCGWGCWMNNTGVAARRVGLDVHVIGVEGDGGHVGFAREALAENGFEPDQTTVRRGIAAAMRGIALFPRQEEAGVHWGLEPIFGATEEQRRTARQSGRYDELPMVTLDELVAPHPRIDLLHVDIQGSETNFIAGYLALLRSRVAYIVLGTHSRQIEGQILEMLLSDGWKLEIERPAIVSLAGSSPQLIVDGVQGWRNPDLTVK
jgi:FkbM family methyltransferase